MTEGEKFLLNHFNSNMGKVMTKLHNIETGLAKVLKQTKCQTCAANDDPNDDENASEIDINIDSFFGIRDESGLIALEQKLGDKTDKTIRKAFIKKCKEILGFKNEKTEFGGRSAALELASTIFHPDFWWFVSWKGGHRPPAHPKFGMVNHVTFLDVFKKIIRDATVENLSDRVFVSIFQNKMKNRVEPSADQTECIQKRRSTAKSRQKAKKNRENEPAHGTSGKTSHQSNQESNSLPNVMLKDTQNLTQDPDQSNVDDEFASEFD